MEREAGVQPDAEAQQNLWNRREPRDQGTQTMSSVKVNECHNSKSENIESLVKLGSNHRK